MPPTMPLSALTSALRRAGRQHLTASTVAAARKTVTGSHVFQIHGYKQMMRKTVPTGTAITSKTFCVGGEYWQINCYPNGKDEEHRGYTSLFLKAPYCIKDTEARFGLTLIGAAGKPTSCARATEDAYFYSLRKKEAGWDDFVRNDDLREGEHLADDCLTVLCDVTLDQGICADEVDADKAVDWSKLPTDVTVNAGGKTFAAHRWVLQAGSPVFRAAFQNTSNLHINGIDAGVVDALLQFMYADDGALPPALRLKVAATAERLLVAADKYRLEKLKLACGEVLCARVDMGSVGPMLALAERHACAVLKDACIKFLSSDGNLISFMATDGFQRLRKDCPAAARKCNATLRWISPIYPDRSFHQDWCNQFYSQTLNFKHLYS